MESEPVDVMTTFNYLVGMKNVKEIKKNIDSVGYTLFEGNVDDEDTLVVWRHDADEVDYEAERENLDLREYNTVYINGDSAIEGTVPIAPEFKRLLFSGGDTI
jgi:hypothetical protein